MARYHTAVFIGRFQPFHRGHLFVFQEALKQAEQLLVLVGSAGGARDLRNPFSFAERQAMISAALPADTRRRVSLKPLQDFTYNDAAWVQSVSDLVAEHVANTAGGHCGVALVGHDKDATTYYLKLFPEWQYIEVGNLHGINATALRHEYFSSEQAPLFDSAIVPAPTLDWLRDFAKGAEYARLFAEYQAVQDFKAAWQGTPYPVIFTTVDALVRWRDEILLIQRQQHPGKDLWALPGGFLQAEETLLQGCLRELQEETHLAVAQDVLRNALVTKRVFDDPKRCQRGRVITHAYYFDLSQLPSKPAARADDDAKDLKWVKTTAIRRQRCFSDHYFIIRALLGG